jgi:hypothetical protein
LWHNHRSGQWHFGGDQKGREPLETRIPSGRGAPERHFDPPGTPGDGNDWVLVLEIA